MTGAKVEAGREEWLGVDLRMHLDFKQEWQRLSHLRLARTPGGYRTHLPDCRKVVATIRVAGECIAWLRGAATIPSGNVTYPIRVDGDAPDCHWCLERGQQR